MYGGRHWLVKMRFEAEIEICFGLSGEKEAVEVASLLLGGAKPRK